jgi:hypothetical protein
LCISFQVKSRCKCPGGSVRATRSNKRRVQILVGLLLTLGVANLPLSTWGGRLKVFGPLLAREVLWGLAVGVLLFYVLRVERRPLSSIGFRRLGLRDILPAILAGTLICDCSSCCLGLATAYSGWIRRRHIDRTLSVATEPVFKHNCSLDGRWRWISLASLNFHLRHRHSWTRGRSNSPQ